VAGTSKVVSAVLHARPVVTTAWLQAMAARTRLYDPLPKAEDYSPKDWARWGEISNGL
jgi:hypothetical protein